MVYNCATFPSTSAVGSITAAGFLTWVSADVFLSDTTLILG